MRTASRVVLFLAIFGQIAVAYADGLTIKRAPKEATIVKYSLTVDFDVNGGQGHIQATVTERITNVDKDGNYTIEQTQSDASGTYNNEKIDVPPRPAVILTYKPNGQVSSIKDTLDATAKTTLIDANSYRMENLADIIDPGKQLQVGDIWTLKIKTDKTLGTVDANAEYKLLAEEKIGDLDTLKIKATVKELDGDKPAENDFTEWISKIDGSMVQMEAKWTNAPFPGVSYPVTATIKMSRIVK